MKLIIAGGRDFNDKQLMIDTLNKLVQEGNIPECPELICGMARGADMTAYSLWVEHNMPVHTFFADWDRFGNSAGYRRNVAMAIAGDTLVAFWDGKSKGTEHMINIMTRYKDKQVFVVRY